MEFDLQKEVDTTKPSINIAQKVNKLNKNAFGEGQRTGNHALNLFIFSEFKLLEI